VPKVDFLILAQAARIEPGGLLNIIGAAWTRLLVTGLPSMQALTLVGRLHFDTDAGDLSANVRVVIRGEPVAGEVAVSAEMIAEPASAVDGQASAVFLLTQAVPITRYGLAYVDVEADGERIGGLAFNVVSE
jgi:hypothetical protein